MRMKNMLILSQAETFIYIFIYVLLRIQTTNQTAVHVWQAIEVNTAFNLKCLLSHSTRYNISLFCAKYS